MSRELKPTKYALEVYENCFSNEPSYHVFSSTPFSSISIGDRFEPKVTQTWVDPPNELTEKFVISEVEHLIFALESYNTHKVMIALKKSFI
ncbi:hypothetical protein CWB72_19475 [Pseudoalteromonas phenolica]|uniref:hypothetical protein n=1 Tax=Pseudoalteromonas phenolica TaxID=161398 RepID=UPI00110A0E9F|nr:hypothetical protein [Pseudoalteromonas phenolica]TMN86525.1 hypothetical protein CWB72_19475 [Pseudoalteromonas phenolica]